MELLDLNDDVLLHILPFLDPTDEFALSQTCTRFKEMCQSGWNSLTLKLGQETKPNERKLKLTEDEMEILEISGDMMQNINISVDFSVADEFDQPSLDLLKTESKKWKLNKFCFDALNMVDSTTILCCRMFKQVFDPAVCYLDSNNTRNANLETLSLSVQDWSPYSFLPRDYLAEKLRSSDCCDSLKNLTLDYFLSCHSERRYMHIWNQRICRVYSGVIGRFKNLQKLEINSAYLSNSLLGTLSQPDRVNLQSVALVLDYFLSEKITSWPQLINSSPSLKVTVEALYDVNCKDVRRVLPACVPIVSWKIYYLPRVRPYNLNKMMDVVTVLCLYEHTLQSVAVQNDSQMLCHSALLDMVTQCSKLQTIYFQGQIHSDTILKIACLQRQRLKLGVLEKAIIFPNFKSLEESREKNIARLCVQVSEKLGYNWKPELEATFKTIFRCPVQTS